MLLFLPHFTPSSKIRKKELKKCLFKNLGNAFFEKIFLFVESEEEVLFCDKKIQVINLGRRPTYRDWILLAKEMQQPSLFANSDIYFRGGLEDLNGHLSRRDVFVALSRHEETEGGWLPHPNPHWSQDCWGIGKVGDLSQRFLDLLAIPVGIPRCDNQVAYLFAVHGWKIVNPFPKIEAIHVHESQERNYDKRGDQTILGGCAYVHPLKDGEVASQLDFSIWVANSQNIRGVVINKTLENWKMQRQES